MEASTGTAQAVSLAKTEECFYITTHFSMGIGRMRQIRDLKVETTADKSQLRHQKQLIDSPELDEIRSQDGYLTRHINSRSAKYDESTRFVSHLETERIYRACEAYRTIRRPQLIKNFMVEYRKLEKLDFEPLREALGDQFDRGDYPSSEKVEAGFYFEFNLRPVGKINLDGLPSAIIESELAKDRQKREQAVIEWQDTLRLAGVKVVDALFDALKPQPDGKKRRLYDSTVTNLTEFLNTFNLRDLAGDTEYQTKVVEPLQLLLKGVSMEKIRHNDGLKEHIVDRVNAIRKDAALLVQATGRKFR